MRLLRGTVVTALVWGIVWAVGFSPILVLNWLTDVQGLDWSVSRLLVSLLAIGMWGAISGGVFALLLAALERRAGWGGLRARRVALWGALAGLVPALVFGFLAEGLRAPSLGVLVICGGSALLGTLLGLLHLRLAQRQPAATPD